MPGHARKRPGGILWVVTEKRNEPLRKCACQPMCEFSKFESQSGTLLKVREGRVLHDHPFQRENTFQFVNDEISDVLYGL